MDFNEFRGLFGLPPRELTPAAAAELAQEWIRQLDRWCELSVSQLNVEAQRVISIANALDGAMTFSPLVSAIYQGADHPRAPITWEESVIIELPAGSLPRFNKLVARAVQIKMARSLLAEVPREASTARWSRLDPVREVAFELHRQAREQAPGISRAESIRRMQSKVVEAARASGEPLTGDTPAVTATITGWFRRKGIK